MELPRGGLSCCVRDQNHIKFVQQIVCFVSVSGRFHCLMAWSGRTVHRQIDGYLTFRLWATWWALWEVWNEMTIDDRVSGSILTICIKIWVKESEEGNWHIEGEDKSSVALLPSLLWCIAAQGSQFAYPFCVILLWKFGRVVMHDATLYFLTPEGWHMDYNTNTGQTRCRTKNSSVVTMSPARANKFNGQRAATWPSTAAANMANNPTSAH